MKMMNIRSQFFVFLLLIGTVSFYSCQSAGGNETGSEYMPDMAHSVAYEANTYGYYYNNRWGSEADLYKVVQPRNPIAGTIARGYAGHSTPETPGRGVAYTSNGSVPYYYANTEEERLRATADIINNPYPITSKSLESGKLLYNIQCGICHGEKGDGAGYLVRDDGGKYPVQPANFLLDDFITSSNGRYYHAIMYGRNLMGSYADKLSYEERWNVIQYIRSLQATSKNLVYSEKSNTFNTTDVAYATIAAKLAAAPSPAPSTIDTTSQQKVEHNNNSNH
jgi:mono/diheme cytochrome c family protein